MFSAVFWKDSADRAIRTFAQALVALLTVGQAITSLDWTESLAVAATSAVVSVLTSVATSGGSNGNASLVPEIRAVGR